MDETGASTLLPEVAEYIDRLEKKHGERIIDAMRLLEEHNGVLGEPYSHNLGNKIRELRIGFGRLEHRVLYTLLPGKEILFITAFLKKTPKVLAGIIQRAKHVREAYLRSKY